MWRFSVLATALHSNLNVLAKCTVTLHNSELPFAVGWNASQKQQELRL